MTTRFLERRAMTVAVLGLAVLGVSGCRVHVEKGAKGEDKNVQVDTPFGGVHVNTDQTTASDLGLPVYPGADQVQDDDHHKSADVHLGFGEWQLRVKAVSYDSADSQDKVVAFYKKALGRFGDVLTCQGKSPVGTPTVTHEGLTCNDDAKANNVHINDNEWQKGVELKAGSRRHQHIVGFEDPQHGRTRFALVALDLPSNMDSDDKKD